MHSESNYRFCPMCATAMVKQVHLSERERNLCPSCGWVHWDNPLPVVAGLVELDGRILLARNAAWPEKMFGLITGFMERGETPEQAMARELAEETSLQVEALHLIGVYEFLRKNEVILAYHVEACGEVQLSSELVDFRMVAPERLRPWRMGTGLAMADWLRARDLPVEFIDLPVRPDETSTAS